MTTISILTPAMSDTTVPEWSGATWIGELDLDTQLADEYELKNHTGFSRARLLVRRGADPLGFAEAAILNGTIAHSAIAAPIADLHANRQQPAAQASPETHSDSGLTAPPVTVVICTRDRVTMLQTALASVLATDYPGLRVVVVDNASATTATSDYVRALKDPRVTLAVEPLPGLSRARNTGLRVAQTEIVAFTDDDVEVDRHWLTGIVAGMTSSDTVACVSGIVPTGELLTPSQAYFDHNVGWAKAFSRRTYRINERPDDQPLFPFQVGKFGTGANFAIKRSTVFDLGGFDERLGVGSPTQGGEDLDIFLRVLLAGHELAYEPSAIVWHRHRADVDALLTQARGYGLGLGAWLTTVALNPAALRRALATVLTGLIDFIRLGRRMARNAVPPADVADIVPRSIRSEQLKAIAHGPRAYRRAAKEGRVARPLSGAPARHD